ncbi:MAG: O-methyltransferase [Bdellovibrionaceae bacterium]|nr:O-methyltransferase [Pseudobdellovibrionaceae bacterium]
MAKDNKAFGQGMPEIAAYAESVFNPIDPVLDFVRRKSAEGELPAIQVGPMDGLHLEILSRLLNPRRVIEVGTLGGYSAICLARGMVSGGVIHTFEKNEKHAALASANIAWAKEQGEFRGVEVTVHVGAAIDMLPKVEPEGPFDLVFIDADKPGYPDYLDWAAKTLRVGGAVLGDNTFAWGQVHRTAELAGNELKMVGSLDRFNRELAAHPRFRSTILPTAEGLTVGVKVR